jgi:hypothetical protein
MPYQQYLNYTGTGTMSSIGLDPSIVPFNANVGVVLSNTATYKLQYSLDPLTTSDSASNWYDAATLGPGTTSSGTLSFSTPISKIRPIISAVNGTVSVAVLQGFTTN